MRRPAKPEVESSNLSLTFLIYHRRLYHNHPSLLKQNKKANAKLTSKEATLLDYSEEGRALLSQQSSVPLEGFATHAVDASIAEFMKYAKNEVESSNLSLTSLILVIS